MDQQQLGNSNKKERPKWRPVSDDFSLKLMQKARSDFRYVMDEFSDDADDMHDVWDKVMELYGVPVKEWGCYPSDKVIDKSLTEKQISEYIAAYRAAYEALEYLCRTKQLFDKEEFWNDFFRR